MKVEWSAYFKLGQSKDENENKENSFLPRVFSLTSEDLFMSDLNHLRLTTVFYVGLDCDATRNKTTESGY